MAGALRPPTPQINAFVIPDAPPAQQNEPESTHPQTAPTPGPTYGEFTERAGYIWARDSPNNQSFNADTIQEWTEDTDQGRFHRQRYWHPPSEKWYYTWGECLDESPPQADAPQVPPTSTSEQDREHRARTLPSSALLASSV